MKLLNEKINELYQSQKKDMGGSGLLWIALVFAILGCFFFVPNNFSDGVFAKVTFGYLIVAFVFLAVLSFASYFYIYSKKKLSKRIAGIVIFLYKIFLILCFVVCIPIIIFLKITEKILSYRAKKLDNLENWLIILVIDLFVIMALCYIDIWSAEKITGFIAYFIKTQYGYDIIMYPSELFIILCLFKVEMDAANIIILKIMNRFGISKIKKKVSKRQKEKANDFLSQNDISKYIDEKNKDIRQYEKSQEDSLKYDLEYQKKTIWKFQLVCLIILFLIATFIPDFLFKDHQGDAINVITIFTLIMLYVDKRKEWR